MPKKTKKIADDKKVQKKPEVKSSPKNGVVSRIGWSLPFSDKDTINFHQPKNGWDNQSRDNFSKLLKDHFGLNLEAAPKDAARRIFTWNRSGKEFINSYLIEMEELDLMPDCKEKFQKKAAAAKELEKGLFFEMAKGSLAICPLGETEPRQVLCDTDPHVFSVSEPLDQSSPAVMHAIYENYKKADLPSEPREPYKPVFTEKAPDEPVPPEPFTMKAPGPKPQPAKLRAFTMKPPVKPERILASRTSEEFEKEVYDEMLKTITLNPPKKPEKVVNDPGEFTLEEPEKPEKREYDLADEPVKPGNYDAVKYQIEQLEKETDALKPARDPRFVSVVLHPGEFTMAEPKKPQLDYPEIPIPPTYKKLPGEPKPKYVFYEPKLILHKPEGIEDPGDKMPDPPEYRKEPLRTNPNPEPEVPTVRNEPPRPGGAKRFFRFLSSSWRAQIRDYDAWVQERDSFPERSSNYNKQRRAWKEECDRIEAEHKAWEEECKQLDADHQKAINEYAEKKLAWDDAIKELGPENEMLRIEHEAMLNDYRKAKAQLGDKFDEERLKYESAHADWEAGLDAESQAIKAENKALQEKYEAESKKFALEEAEYYANYDGCDNDPEKMKDRRGELEGKYEEEVREYNELKAKHESLVENYNNALERVRQTAIKEGRDPEADVKDYEDYIAKNKAYDAKAEELSDFIANNPEVGEYDSRLEEYREDQSLRESAEEVYKEDMEDYEAEHREWKAAKDEHDAKVAAFKDYSTELAKFQKEDAEYKYKMANLAKDAKTEARRRIEENEKEINEVFPAKEAEYKHEKEAYDDAYWRWKQGCYDMEKPGGLIYNWEENVKKYNSAKKAHDLAQKKYISDSKAYPGKLQEYNTKLNAHIKEMEKYNKMMSQYKIQKDKYDSVVILNNQSRAEHLRVLNSNPAYRDYSMKPGYYINGYNKWKDQIKGSNQYNALQRYNPQTYKEQQQDVFKDYEKRKKNAPERYGGKEAKEYTERVWEHNYLKNYPTEMHPYLKVLNRQENEVNAKLNSKFKKESDISLNDYKDAAVEKMYFSLTRDRIERFARERSGLGMNTKPIDKLLDPTHFSKCKEEMLGNKGLMKRLETEYKEAKKYNRVSKSLQDGEDLRNIYKDTYVRVDSKKAVKDPVFGEYHGSPKAVEEAKAKDPMAGIH